MSQKKKGLEILKNFLGALWLRYPLWKQVQALAPVALTRQYLGVYLDGSPQPLGLSAPMAQGHPMTTGIRDVDLILSQALRMNMHEVPSYYGSLVNNTTLELQSRSIIFGKNPICQLTISLSRFIAKQVPRRSGLYLNHERNVTTLWPDVKMMVSPMKLIVYFCNAKTIISVRQSKSIEDREIGKQFAPLWRVLAKQLKILFPGGDDEGAFIIPALDTRSQVLSN